MKVALIPMSDFAETRGTLAECNKLLAEMKVALERPSGVDLCVSSTEGRSMKVAGNSERQSRNEFSKRLDQSLQEALLASREDESRDGLAAAKFRAFAEQLVANIEGVAFRRVCDDCDVKVSMREYGTNSFRVELRHAEGDDNWCFRLAEISRRDSDDVLWMVSIRNRGHHHKFRDGSEDCWIRSPDDPRIDELKQWIEDELIDFASVY